MDPFNSNINENLHKATKRMADGGITLKYRTSLQGGQQGGQQPSSPIASPAASIDSTGTGTTSSSPSGSSMSEFLNSAQLSQTLPKARPTPKKANASTRKRPVLYDHEPAAKFPSLMNPFFMNSTSQTEPCSNISTKKLAQTAAKSPESALPSIGTSTIWKDEQFKPLFEMFNQHPELIQGLLNSFPIVTGTPTGSSAAQGTSSTSSTVTDSRLNAGGRIANWTGGNGRPTFGSDPLFGPGFFNKITFSNAMSLSFSSTTLPPAPSQPTTTYWPDFFRPPFVMPLSPYDTKEFPTKDETDNYCLFLLEARVQADLHRLDKNQTRRFTTEAYRQLYDEAKRNEEECTLYRDKMIGTPQTLFNSNKLQGVPQSVRIGITCPTTMYNVYNSKQESGIARELWNSLEWTDPAEYHSWCKKAIEIDQEQLKQLVKGFIGKGNAYRSERKDNWLNELN